MTEVHGDPVQDLNRLVSAEHEKLRLDADMDERFQELANLTIAYEKLLADKPKMRLEVSRLKAANIELTSKADELSAECDRLRQEVAEAEARYNDLTNSFFWKVTRPVRRTIDVVRGPQKSK